MHLFRFYILSRICIYICIVIMYTWLIYVSDMGHSFAWHESFVCDLTQSRVTHTYVTRLIQICQDSFICYMTHPHGTCLIHTLHDSFMCDSMHSYVTCDRIRYMWHDPSITNCVSHGVRFGRDSCVWHDSSICDMTHSCITWLIHHELCFRCR